MKRISPFVLGLSLAVACGSMAAAQESSQGTPAIPKVLQVTREFTKPYKGGSAHDKAESVFVQAMRRANWPTHYLAITSMSGKPRALFLMQYDSFAAWEKDNAAAAKNSALTAELDRAGIADGELLDSVDQEVFYYNEELSYKPMADLSHRRYMEIAVYHVRPGHGAEWRELVKMVKEAHEKAGTSAHWAAFELVYGGEDGTYALFSSDKSLADVDTGFAEDKQFREAMGEEGMKKLHELFGAAVDTSHQELFAFNPHMSYAPDEWIKADPDFWKPKPAAAPAAKPAMEEKKTKP